MAPKLPSRILPGVIDFVIITMMYKLLNYSILFLWEMNGCLLFSGCFFVYYLVCYLGFKRSYCVSATEKNPEPNMQTNLIWLQH